MNLPLYHFIAPGLGCPKISYLRNSHGIRQIHILWVKSIPWFQNFWNRTIFKGSPWASKFYYITHQCEICQNRKIDFFKFFTSNYVFIFKTINSHKKYDFLRYIMVMYTGGHNVVDAWFLQKCFNSFDSLPVGIKKLLNFTS